jgi:uncharacterized membrane protein YidH (DUF202 family)
MTIIIIIGIIIIGLNLLRFLLGNYFVLKSKKYNIKLKVWNIVETLLMIFTFVILVIKYFKI